MADTKVFLSGGRIQGRSDDSVTVLDSIPQTSWKELARTTLSSTSATIDSGTFTAKDNLMILYFGVYNSTHVQAQLEVGNGTIDTGDNYAYRHSRNGTSDNPYTDRPRMFYFASGNAGSDEFGTCSIRNIVNKEKLAVAHGMNTGTDGNGADNAPERAESVGKWTGSAVINRVQVRTANLFGVGSEIVVLGCDDDEADSGTNFWQELTNTSTIGTPKVTNTTTAFTAKKYLMFTAHTSSINNSNHGNSYLRMGSSGTIDTGASYAWNIQINGGTNGTGVDYTNGMYCHDYGSSGGGDHGGLVYTGYIVNVADREKMVIMDAVEGNNGASNAPRRQETCGKWANTSAQANILQINTSGSSDAILAASFRVWGSD